MSIIVPIELRISVLVKKSCNWSLFSRRFFVEQESLHVYLFFIFFGLRKFKHALESEGYPKSSIQRLFRSIFQHHIQAQSLAIASIFHQRCALPNTTVLLAPLHVPRSQRSAQPRSESISHPRLLMLLSLLPQAAHIEPENFACRPLLSAATVD